MNLRTVATLAALAITCLAGHEAAAQADPTIKVFSGTSQAIGNGSARAYAALDASGALLGLGFSLDRGALDGLPVELNKTSRCFQGMCIGDTELVLALPEGEAGKAVGPFKWLQLNWNPKGHGVPAPPPWAVPHFDFHFYVADRPSILALRTGSCGEMIDCEDFKNATKPVPAVFVHPDHINVDAAVPAMGNHLIDAKSPELAPDGPKFTHTFIVGANDGHVAFYEPMVTLAYLASRPDMCAPIKQAAAWEFTGQYPTKYCVRYLDRTGRTTVSLEGFVSRAAR
jgi:hypothetical protein